ncbi:Tetratricopeptide repeat (TPR)-like superfamily protein [Striga hermonthica]|uniref:Tetratricopeptide repeat (TPR)-like superfamily protein n=1 Tax=Striga hermonthica TaxID=68872 RepID=A0A9N7NCT3_STRHE|nr:Tetratricopeptide repeat (TPR)-like superfamily protein [Striga hermonthica]
MATLIQPTNFISAPPSKPQLLKTPCIQTHSKSSLSSLTHKVSLSSFNKSLDEAYASALDHCAAQSSLSFGKQIHTHVIKRNNTRDLDFLRTKLVLMYGKCGSLLEARHVFDEMAERSIFTYNAMLGAYISNGEPMKAIKLYAELRFLGIRPDAHTCSCVLKACSQVEDIRCGKEIHGYVVKSGFLGNGVVVNSLVGVYAQCGDLKAAELMFGGGMRSGDVVLWNLMISAYFESGMAREAWKAFVEMQNAGVTPSTYTFVAVLQACEDLLSGMQTHAVGIKLALCFDRYVGNAFLVMYSKFGRVDEAARVFYGIAHKDNFSWNSMLDAYVENGLYDESLVFFREMVRSGVGPDQVSVIGVLSACGKSRNILNGMETHAFALKNRMESGLEVGNTITDMYAKCRNTGYMETSFSRITGKDYISWTTVISGYIQNFHYTKGVQLLRDALLEGIRVDKTMLGIVLLACRGLKCVSQAKEIHGYVVRNNNLTDIVLQNTIVDIYGQCEQVGYARNVFKLIENKNAISWTSMIDCHVHNGLAHEALRVSTQMVKSGVELDPVALLCILSAITNLSALRKGKEIHGFLIRKCLHLWESIPSSLVDMYASCGAVDSSQKVFDSVEDDKDLVLWTSMINAHGLHGQGTKAIELFENMEGKKSVRPPDHIVFLALLHACSHSSLVDEGKKIFFDTMQNRYNLEPWPEHHACLVDLLGRANRLEEAIELVKTMKPGPTAAVWCALLGACRTHSNMEIGEIAARELLELEPENPGNYVLVSNLYASAGKWDEVERVRTIMKAKGLKKDPGCSWIEIKNEVHTFFTGDRCHPRSDEIYGKLDEIVERLESVGGYRAETSHVLHDVEEDEKKRMLYGHSERLALAYGLLSSSTGRGVPIRVSKNLRVCRDCHDFTKLVSKVFEREIVVRDANRFHHFKDGVCSCGDFW